LNCGEGKGRVVDREVDSEGIRWAEKMPEGSSGKKEKKKGAGHGEKKRVAEFLVAFRTKREEITTGGKGNKGIRGNGVNLGGVGVFNG